MLVRVRLVRVRLVRVGFAVLLDEAVVFVWVTSASESDISKESIRQGRDSIRQGREAARDYISLWPLP